MVGHLRDALMWPVGAQCAALFQHGGGRDPKSPTWQKFLRVASPCWMFRRERWFFGGNASFFGGTAFIFGGNGVFLEGTPFEDPVVAFWGSPF